MLLAVMFLVASAAFAQSFEDNWNDFLHYTKIGRFDLAKGYAQAVLESSPDPVEMLALSEENPQGYAILLKVGGWGMTGVCRLALLCLQVLFVKFSSPCIKS